MNAESIFMVVFGSLLSLMNAVVLYRVGRLERKSDARDQDRKAKEILHSNCHMQSGDLLIAHVDKAVENGENGRQKELLEALKNTQSKYKESITEAAADRAVYK